MSQESTPASIGEHKRKRHVCGAENYLQALATVLPSGEYLTDATARRCPSHTCEREYFSTPPSAAEEEEEEPNEEPEEEEEEEEEEGGPKRFPGGAWVVPPTAGEDISGDPISCLGPAAIHVVQPKAPPVHQTCEETKMRVRGSRSKENAQDKM